jgi:glycosyltransferase involved in cell wall biosynthesis
MRSLKILHVTSCRELSEGQRKQLRYEKKAATRIDSITWDIVAFQINAPIDSFERQYPRFFRFLFLRNLYTWLFLLRVHSGYDVVLLRYMSFDPFLPIFGFLVKNRFTIHHSKEIEELKLVRRDWRGEAASFLEKLMGFVNSRQVKGLLGVTREIADYQRNIHKASCPAGFYPNGIDINQIDILEDLRGPEVQMAFVCGKFAPWHGLDRLIDAAKAYDMVFTDGPITIHLVGKLDPDQLKAVSYLNLKSVSMLCYGHMGYEEYKAILARCDVGIDSLGLDIKGLKEATALKAREYLAFGLPVYSAFKDSAIPANFPYYRKGPVNLDHMAAYALELKGVPRPRVRAASISYIEKHSIMMQLSRWLDNL